MKSRKRVVSVSLAVMMFIMMSALFATLSQAIVVANTNTPDEVSVSDCTCVGISMNIPPDMENKNERGSVFLTGNNFGSILQKTDSYFNSSVNYGKEYKIYCGMTVSSNFSEIQTAFADRVVMLC